MMSRQEIIEVKDFRILCVAEVRGELSELNILAEKHHASVIVHTGNFGFFDESSIGKVHESYLRHIIAFSPLISDQVKSRVNRLSKINNNSNNDGEGKLIDHVKNERLSELDKFLLGELKFKVPVYTIYGMIEDTSVINRFKLGIYNVPNLHLIDENNSYTINIGQDLSVCLLGLGGALNISKLFFHGTYDDSIQNEVTKIPQNKQNDKFFVPASGDPGNTWMTLLQIGKLIKTVNNAYKSSSKTKTAVKIFVTHSSPSKESLLGHLAIFLKADYTISNSLHFLYSSSYNELSICPNYEFFKNKFIDSKLQLIKIWKNIKSTIELITKKEDNPNKSEISELFEIALNCFDRIPISSSTLAPNSSLTLKSGGTNGASVASNNNNNSGGSVASGTASFLSATKNIIPLSLYNKSSLANDAAISKRQNDSYYSAFQNLWHFNLCDMDKGYMVLNVVDSSFQMENFSTGFDFSFRKLSLNEGQEDDAEDLTAVEYYGKVRDEDQAGSHDASFNEDGNNDGGEYEDEEDEEEDEDEEGSAKETVRKNNRKDRNSRRGSSTREDADGGVSSSYGYDEADEGASFDESAGRNSEKYGGNSSNGSNNHNKNSYRYGGSGSNSGNSSGRSGGGRNKSGGLYRGRGALRGKGKGGPRGRGRGRT